MKRVARGPAIIAAALLLSPPAFASTLESRKNEWALDFSYADHNSDDPAIDYERDTSVDVGWAWVFGKGRHEVGALVSYFNLHSVAPGVDRNGMAIGPRYTFNWTPAKDKVTGFVEVAYGTTSGDLGDFFDSVVHLGVGGRVFVWKTASLRIVYSMDQLAGATGFADADSTGLAVGMSFFTHGK